MRRYFTIAMVVILIAVISIGITTPYKTTAATGSVATRSWSLKDEPLSLLRLPAAGYVALDPLNSNGLEAIGLGGPAPANDPPDVPYNKDGIFWSEPFSLVEGDTLQVTVYSDSPVSWFGIDWSNLYVRGILATNEMDEDGKDFNPQYPVRSSLEQSPESYKLTVSYKIIDDTDCVLVVKNGNPNSSVRLSMTVSLKPSISFRRVLKRIPILKNFVSSNHNDEDDD